MCIGQRAPQHGAVWLDAGSAGRKNRLPAGRSAVAGRASVPESGRQSARSAYGTRWWQRRDGLQPVLPADADHPAFTASRQTAPRRRPAGDFGTFGHIMSLKKTKRLNEFELNGIGCHGTRQQLSPWLGANVGFRWPSTDNRSLFSNLCIVRAPSQDRHRSPGVPRCASAEMVRRSRRPASRDSRSAR